MLERKALRKGVRKGAGRSARRTLSASPSQKKRSVRLLTPTDVRPPVDGSVRGVSAADVNPKASSVC